MSYNIPIASITNYCTNPGSEIGTLGWATFADAAATSPVDGTGGSPNSTLTQSTTSPLRGYSSFLWTKNSGASRQGEGFSYDFTINAMDKGQVLQISYSYLIASGTFADNDMTVWVYDVTNATMTQVAPTNILNTSIVQNWQGIFQTATNSTSYRLIFYVPVTTNSANTVQFDNFYVGPQIKSYGPFISDWISYTPTGAWTSNTTYAGKWRRVGDSMEVDAYISLSGAPTAASLYVNLPSGYSIDTAKISSSGLTDNTTILGQGKILDNGVGGYYASAAYNNTTSVFVNAVNASATYATNPRVDATTPITFASGDAIHINFKVPITGWSSGQLLSSDSGDSRVVALDVYRTSSDQTITAANTDETVVFNSVRIDTAGTFNASTGVYTVSTPGKYQVTYGIYSTQGATAASSQYAAIFKNGASPYLGVWQSDNLTNSKKQMMNGSVVVDCIAGDTLRVIADSTTQNITIKAGSGTNGDTSMQIVRLTGGGQQIAASESVNARYTTNSGQSISNSSTTIIDFEDKVYDSHNSTTTGASWKYTASGSGKFAVKAAVQMVSGGGWSAGEYAILFIYKNGSEYSRTQQNQSATHTSGIDLAISDSISLIAGDYVDIRIEQNSGGAIALANNGVYNYVSITRVGN